MNCKPGDLAVIVSPRGANEQRLRGALMHIVGPYQGPIPRGWVGHYWQIEPLSPCIAGMQGVCDEDIRPLRDGGPQEQDQTLRPREEVTA